MNATSSLSAATSEYSPPRTDARIFEPLRRYLLAVIYGSIMIVLYSSLSIYWKYLGFAYESIGELVVPLVTVSAIPALFLPRHPTSLPQFAAWLFYFTLFLPGLIIPQLQGWLFGADALWLFVVLFGSVFLFVAMAGFRTAPWSAIRFDKQIFWLGLIFLWVAMHGAIVLFFGKQLSVAAINDVYQQRADAVSQIGGAGYVGYIINNASGAVNPVLVGIGFRERKWWAVAMGVVGQVIVYSSLAGKIVLLFPLVTIGTFFLFDKSRRMRPTRLAVVMVLVALLGIPLQLRRDSMGETISQLTDLIYMRTLYLPGVLIGAYHDFFSIYPLTYFSHTIVGRQFIEYPYGGLSVGQVVGAYVTPGIGYQVNNYNANFIAADGIASLGTLGIPLIMLVAILLLRFIEKVLGNLDVRVRCAVYVPFLMWLSDGSLPTALLTGGGVLITLLMWLYLGTESESRIDEPGAEGIRDDLDNTNAASAAN